MKNFIDAAPDSSPISWIRCFKIQFRNVQFAILVFTSVFWLSTNSLAANLLVNPSFEANSGHVVAAGWTYFTPPESPGYFGDYWVESAVTPHSGSYYWKQWGALYSPTTNNVAGVYQDFSSAPGSTFTASGWFYTHSTDILGSDCYVWIEVGFYGASSNLLALYKSDNFNAAVGADNWFQYQVVNACDISSPVSTGDPYFNTYAVTGTVSQLVAPVGTTTVRYRFAYLQYLNEGGSAYLDDAVLNQVAGPIPPVISSLSPLNMIFVNPNDGLSFNVSSPSGFTINTNAIHLALNGVDVSSGLAISGSTSNRNVAYHGLLSNLTYTASITATDSFGFSVSANTYFETTWVGTPPIVYLWEAEDFDFTNGMYINVPQLCAVPDNPNCYFGKVGTPDVDEGNVGGSTFHQYRADDAVGTKASGDYFREDHVLAGVTDYRIDPFNGSEWLNYTRDWSNGTFWVIGRLSTDVNLSGSVTLSIVNPDTTTTDLGTFSIASGRGWDTYDTVFLKDTNGNNAAVTLDGHATLRVTSGGNLLPNFFALVAGQIDLPALINLYPTGRQPFEYTNTLSFTLSTRGSSFPANGITVLLDGADVSSNLVITGSASTKNVVYPNLLPNAMHLAIIAATNALGHGIRITNQFDTFSLDNYMVEAEDFDYGGAQFASPWFPGAYQDYAYARDEAITNVDFHHTYLSGQTNAYRSDGLPTFTDDDYLRPNYAFVGDYSVTYFANGDWADYTRDFPAGNYYIYGRLSGGVGLTFTMYLDQVLSGTGTVTQVTRRLGQWSAPGRDYVNYDWVPLTDDGSAPVAVSLNGQTTLRITTTGYCNPNYFMLVPATGVTMSATHSGGNLVLSFPTQPGVVYRVLYRTDLGSGGWTLLTSIVGDGTTKSVSDPATAARRFYKIVAP